MENRVGIFCLILCVAAATTNCHEIFGARARKDRRGRQCPTCPGRSLDSLTSDWPLNRGNSKISRRYYRDTGFHESRAIDSLDPAEISPQDQKDSFHTHRSRDTFIEPELNAENSAGRKERRWAQPYHPSFGQASDAYGMKNNAMWNHPRKVQPIFTQPPIEASKLMKGLEFIKPSSKPENPVSHHKNYLLGLFDGVQKFLQQKDNAVFCKIVKKIIFELIVKMIAEKTRNVHYDKFGNQQRQEENEGFLTKLLSSFNENSSDNAPQDDSSLSPSLPCDDTEQDGYQSWREFLRPASTNGPRNFDEAIEPRWACKREVDEPEKRPVLINYSNSETADIRDSDESSNSDDGENDETETVYNYGEYSAPIGTKEPKRFARSERSEKLEESEKNPKSDTTKDFPGPERYNVSDQTENIERVRRNEEIDAVKGSGSSVGSQRFQNFEEEKRTVESEGFEDSEHNSGREVSKNSEDIGKSKSFEKFAGAKRIHISTESGDSAALTSSEKYENPSERPNDSKRQHSPTPAVSNEQSSSGKYEDLNDQQYDKLVHEYLAILSESFLDPDLRTELGPHLFEIMEAISSPGRGETPESGSEPETSS